jgi:molybdate transport system substrate-binding protein
VVVLLALGAGCGRDVLRGDPDAPLFFYCGAGLRLAAEPLIAAFRERTGIVVDPTFTGSGCLVGQAEMGRTGDLFMPGELFYMQQAADRGLVTQWRVVAWFVPVILVRDGNPLGIHTLEDLYRPGVRVGLGEPKACAIGDFTPRLLAAKGLSAEALEPNVVATFVTAPEIGNAVKLGSIDAAIQWDAVAAAYLEGGDVVPIPTEDATRSAVPLGVLATSARPDAARAFLEFVAGPEGQAILESHHYTVDPSRPTFPPEEGIVERLPVDPARRVP